MRTNIPRRYTFILSNGQSGVLTPIRIRHFCLLQNVQTAQGPTQLPIQWVQEFIPGCKAAGVRFISPQTSAEVVNERNCYI
jgi:hypothetical protein